MAIESATSNLSNTSTNTASTVNQSKSAVDTKKNSETSSNFKDEMSKINTDNEASIETNQLSLENKKLLSDSQTYDAEYKQFGSNVVMQNVSKKKLEIGVESEEIDNPLNLPDEPIYTAQIASNVANFDSVQDKDANAALSDNIELMISIKDLKPNIENLTNLDKISDKNATNNVIKTSIEALCTIGTSPKPTAISMTEDDVEFFAEIASDNNSNINIQSVINQARKAVELGNDVKQVQKSSAISESLLNAINIAKETNQPLRVDFDNNISVVMRISRDGVLAANFIPGDKVVEQYLRNNIESLRNSFDENNLPYSDLSYSNSSKEQNRRRREQNRQGE